MNEKLLNTKQAADYLNVCKNTIDNLESEGLIKGRRIYRKQKKEEKGKKEKRKKPIVRFWQEDLDNLFQKRTKGRPKQEEIHGCGPGLPQRFFDN